MAVGLIAAGTALSIFGQMQANFAQAQAERENAAWLDEQANFLEQSSAREAKIFERQARLQIGEQIGGFSASGVELSGSALDTIRESFSLMEDELQAISDQGRMSVREALLKSGASRRNANRLGSFGLNAIQASGTALTGAGTAIRST